MKKLNLLFAFTSLTFIFVSIAYSQKNDKFLISKQAIPNRYIVVFNDDKNTINSFNNNQIEDEKVRRTTRDLSLLYGGQVDRQYSRAIKGYAAAMPREQALALSRDPRVKYVEEDFFIFKDQTQTNATTGLDRIDQRNLPLDTIYNYLTTGTGVHAYVIDSGIRATHTEFTGRIGNGQDFVNDGQGTNDCDGHGTHVSGTIGGTTYGVAKNVTLHPLRIFNCQGVSSGSGSLAAIDWITANRVPNAPGVVNMSLGGGYSTTSNTAVANSIAQTGLTYVVSAGNDNNDACDKSPASTPQAITVGSSRPTTDFRSTFSNYGVCVDVFAPGSSITSASHNSDTGTAIFSGTSMSAPHVSGIVARFLQNNPNATPAQVENSVINSATNGVIIDPGVGSPNRLVFADVVFNNTPTTPPTPGPAPAVRIPEQGVGTPYPSEYVVSGGPTFIGSQLGSVIVSINRFSHTATGEVSLVLEGPTGAKILLQSGAGFNEDANNTSYVIRDDGVVMSSTVALTNGTTYKPTAHNAINFPAPGPGSSYNNPGPVNGGSATLASTFGGTNSNGIWKLYVKDENLGDRGRIDSWSVTAQAPPPPTAPSNLQVDVFADTFIGIKWNANPLNENIVSYNVRVNGGSLISVNNSGASIIGYVANGLSPGTAYTFQVQAVSASGTLSSFSSITPSTRPSAPTNFQASVVSTNQINISWNANPPSQNVVSYNVRINGGQPITGIASTTYSATGLTPSTNYTFEVQAITSSGLASTWSNVTGTTLSSGITLSSTPATSAPNGTVTVNWTAQSARPGTDWIGVYQVGAANNSLFAWQYVTPGTSGSNVFQMPGVAGPHEFRYFTNNSFNLGAVSPVTIAVPSTTITLSSTPATSAPNGTVTVNWTAQNARPGTDWIGVYQVGAANNSLFAWQYVTPGTSGSNVFQMPGVAGPHEFRYFTNNSFNLAGTSPVTIAVPSTTITLSSTPATSAPNGTVTVNWTAQNARPGTDWIGVYQVGAANNSLFAWQYVTPGTSGSNVFQMPGVAGPHEFRYFTNNSFNLAGTSPVTIAVPTSTVAVSASPTNIAPRGVVTVNWTAQNARPGTDWIGVYQVGAANNSLFAWQYVTPGTSGSNVFQMPGVAGPHEFRYFTNNSFNLAGTSPVTIAVPSTTITLSSTPATSAPNGTVTVNWTAQNARPGTDWIGVYQVGAANNSLFAWQYVTPGTSGSNVFQMPGVAGPHEFRYFTNNSFNLAGTSNQVNINVSQPASLTFTPPTEDVPILAPTPLLIPTPAIGSTAAFVSFDSITQGNWINNYGGQGYIIVGDEMNLPNWVQLSNSVNGFYIWENITSDSRALRKVNNSNDRIAATWLTPTVETGGTQVLSFNFIDGKPHRLALYAVDWDNSNRSEIFEVIDKASGTILDTKVITGFNGGVYLNWIVNGQITIKVKSAIAANPNGIISGVFID